MRQTHTLCLLALIAGCTAWQNLLPHQPVAALLGRQDGECTIQSTCAQCFGEGSVICDNIGCYNPNKHEQCCSGASICVGKDNSCCSAWGGPGVSGTAGVPNATAAETAPAPTTSDVSWECTRLDSGEQCCQRAPIPLHWCSGDYPSQRCYNPKNQFCCTDGTVCDEKDCCALFTASTTNPYLATITNGPSTTSSTSSQGAPANTTSANTSGTSAAPTTTKSGADLVSRPGLAVLAVSVAGLGLIFSLYM